VRWSPTSGQTRDSTPLNGARMPNPPRGQQPFWRNAAPYSENPAPSGGRRGRIVRYRYRMPPKWARDGGAGSVVSVEGMREMDYQLAWRLLEASVKGLQGYSVDLEVVQDWMNSITDALLEAKD